MSIFLRLQENKGTVSSALGKSLAEQVLAGEEEILSEAIDLVNFSPDDIKAKSIRAGAAKIVEKVAEKKPELVADCLSDLLPALDLLEAQTRWMIIQVFGYCAELNPDIAEKAFNHAKHYLAIQQGVCLSGAAARYLGQIGALSPDHAKNSFPVLLKALDKALPNEVDWILEGFLEIYDNLDEEAQKEIVRGAVLYSDAPKKSTRQRVKKVIAKTETGV